MNRIGEKNIDIILTQDYLLGAFRKSLNVQTHSSRHDTLNSEALAWELGPLAGGV